MIPRTLVVALLVGGGLTAAAGGGYLAVRHNTAERAPSPAEASILGPDEDTSASKPVSETEAEVEGGAGVDSAPIEVSDPAPAAAPVATPPSAPAVRPEARPRREPIRNARSEPPAPVSGGREVVAPVTEQVEPLPASAPTPEAWPVTEPLHASRPQEPPAPQFTEVVIPAAAVIGLQVETTLSSERNQIEDRVDARVTRDVLAEGRVAIPAGSRVIGNVTLVERGGKMKERARLGVRFHTVVLAGGVHVPLRTETIFREGDSPSGESARKIGGAAAGGAILGAILGGGKGAAIGSAAGAGAGTAAVMAGGRNHATLPSGTTVTARLSSPVVVELER